MNEDEYLSDTIKVRTSGSSLVIGLNKRRCNDYGITDGSYIKIYYKKAIAPEEPVKPEQIKPKAIVFSKVTRPLTEIEEKWIEEYKKGDETVRLELEKSASSRGQAYLTFLLSKLGGENGEVRVS